MSDTSFFTQASNLFNSTSGNVDVRTGLFLFHINVGDVHGNYTLGPTLPLQLNYSPLNNHNIGFGKGINTNFSYYNTQTNTLHLSSGESYKIQMLGNKAFVRQNKIDSFSFERLDNSSYILKHQSGLCEILQGDQNGSWIKMPTEIINACGQSVTLTYNSQNRLTEIKDNDQISLLKISYSYTEVNIQFYPETSEEHHVILSLNNELLEKITLTHPEKDTVHKDNMVWNIFYINTSFGQWAYSIIHPNGLVEKATYRLDNNGHKFPSSYPAALTSTSLPYVETYEQDPGMGQEKVQKRYSYSSFNFLGYGALDISWDPNQDNLMNTTSSDYCYHTQEDVITKDITITSKYTYNNYHLLIERQKIHPKGITKETTTYDIIPGQTLDNQPQTYQLPKTITTTWIKGNKEDSPQRSESTYYEYNNSGLKTLEIKNYDPSLSIKQQKGETTYFDYYPANGENGKCPASPHGMVSFIKKKTISPSSFSQFTNRTKHIEEYLYKEFSSSHPNIPYAVLNTEMNIYKDDKKISNIQTTYSSKYMGLATHVQTMKLSPYDQNTSEVITHHTEHEFKDNEVHMTYTISNRDSHETAVSKEVKNRFTHLVTSQTSPHQCVHTNEYDPFKRTTKITYNKGSAYEINQSFDYDMHTNDVPFTIHKEDCHGNNVKVMIDGLGRQTQIDYKINEPNSMWKTATKHVISPFNTETSKSAFIYSFNDPNYLKEDKVTYDYDEWNSQDTITLENGLKRKKILDPVNLTITTYIIGEKGKTTKKSIQHLNNKMLPVKVEIYNSNNDIITEEIVYDDLSQIREYIDAHGNVTKYEYDVFGHIICETLPDGTQIKREYNLFAEHESISKIYVNDILLGEREFDAWNRITKVKTGGRTITYTYEGTNTNPSSIKTNLRETNFTYDPILQAPIERISGDIIQKFSYDKYGRLIKAHEGNSEISYTYNTKDCITQQDIRIDNNTYSFKYDYLSSEYLEKYTGISGMISYTYDALCRPTNAETETVNIVFEYDDFGRLCQWTTTDKKTNHEVKTTLTFDDLGREKERNIDSVHGTWVINKEYTALQQISKKVTLFNNTNYRTENYEYDNRDRLIHYTCSGTTCPLDQYGNIIKSQSFAYDSLNNITQCITIFKDNSQNTASYNYVNDADPCQLTLIRNTHPSYRNLYYGYNDDGELILDENYQYAYDDMGRLQSIASHEKKQIASYAYNALNQMIKHNNKVFHYYNKTLMEISNDEAPLMFLKGAAGCHAQISSDQTWLVANSEEGTPITVETRDQVERTPYSPYGVTKMNKTNVYQLGYNGEYFDKDLQAYHLGNGYRVYNPNRGVFNSPDSLSPFSQGAINSYMYCDGDPVNRSDPSGHNWLKWLGLGLAVVTLVAVAATGVGAVLEAGGVGAALAGAATSTLITEGLATVSAVTQIASIALEKAAPKISSILDKVATVTGLLSIGISAAVKMAPNILKMGEIIKDYTKRIISSIPSIIKNMPTIAKNTLKAIREWWAEPTDWAAIGRAIKTVARHAVDVFFSTITEGIKTLKISITAIVVFAGNNTGKVLTYVGKLLNAIHDMTEWGMLKFTSIERNLKTYILHQKPMDIPIPWRKIINVFKFILSFTPHDSSMKTFTVGLN